MNEVKITTEILADGSECRVFSIDIGDDLTPEQTKSYLAAYKVALETGGVDLTNNRT